MDFFSAFLFRPYQRVAHLEYGLSRQASTASTLQWELEKTQHQLNKTMLAVEALVEILCDRDILTRDEILARIAEIDLRDGQLDGQMTPEATACNSCQRPLGAKMEKCIYCGAVRPPGSGVVG